MEAFASKDTTTFSPITLTLVLQTPEESEAFYRLFNTTRVVEAVRREALSLDFDKIRAALRNAGQESCGSIASLLYGY